VFATVGPARDPRRFSISLGEASGAVADLGVLIPLSTALVLVNGLDAGAVLIAAGALVVVSGAWFGIPFPVQPLKALTAVAVAEALSPGVIHAAGFEIGVFLLLLSIRGVAGWLARLFTKPVVRALQLGVGVLLLVTAYRLAAHPPDVFVGSPASPWPLVLATASFVGVAWAARRRWYGSALGLVAVGIVAVWAAARPAVAAPSFHLPHVGFPAMGDFGTAFLLLVIPQIPLTFGNAVVAVTDLAHEYFGPRGRRVTPSRVCVSCGVGNLMSAALGGMPMCHGAGGLTAHVRLGARTAGMNLILGTTLMAIGLFFAPQVPVLFGLFPVWVLAGFLAYAGLRHAWLVADLRGWQLGLAVVAGLAGAGFSNLAVTAGISLLVAHGTKAVTRLRAGRARVR
jgi:sulfate permease, SulP family